MCRAVGQARQSAIRSVVGSYAPLRPKKAGHRARADLDREIAPPPCTAALVNSEATITGVAATTLVDVIRPTLSYTNARARWALLR